MMHLAIVAALITAFGRTAQADPPVGESSPERRPRSALRIAHARDGVHFQDAGIPFSDNGSNAAACVQGRNLFVAYDVENLTRKKGSQLVLTRSPNLGATWSPAEPVRVIEKRGRNSRPVADARNPALLCETDGSLRLFFVTGSGRRTRIASAVSRDGREFVVDPSLRVAVAEDALPNPTVARIGNHLHLFSAMIHRRATGNPAEPSQDDASPADAPVSRTFLDRFMSPDGRRLTRLAPVELPVDAEWSSVVARPDGLTFYGSQRRDMTAATSSNARNWTHENRLRAPRGWDPAVVPLPGGAALMIHGVPGNSVPTETRATIRLDDSFRQDFDVSTAIVDPREPDFSETQFADASNLNADPALRSGEDFQSFAESGMESPSPCEHDPDALDFPDLDGIDALDPIHAGFAPVSDLVHRVDYLAWYRNFIPAAGPDNAYVDCLALLKASADAGETWNGLRDMNSDDEYTGPPAPWDPAERPEWSATGERLAPWLERFRQAAERSGYAHTFELDDIQPTDDGERLLLNLTLPHLPAHRVLTKSLLADSWKKIDGKVPPRRLTDAWKTILRGAEHLENGTTLIEQLVGHAERGLVYRDARWALHHKVFTGPDELEAALETLDRFGWGLPDPTRFVRGEHAMAMDLTQYLFSPPDDAGQPRPNLHRAKAISEILDAEHFAEKVASLGPREIRAEIRNIDDFYAELSEQVRVGYPDVRAADFDATAERYQRSGAWSSDLLPSFSRAMQIRSRTEALSRATRLTYHTHLFRARNGRWPVNLDELNLPSGNDLRTDPFTGRDFAYRLSDEGPRIYSLAENGRDDGGVHHQPWQNNDDPDGPDDFVIWPPQHVP